MTREVAIDNLRADIKYWENTSVSTEHLYMAIEALEQEPCDDCPEKTDDNECISQSHCFEVKRMAIQALKQMDALDKITVELKSVKEKWWYGVDNDCFMKLSDVLQIIDKYRKEQTEE